MGFTIDLTNTERRVSTAEFALRMNISEKSSINVSKMDVYSHRSRMVVKFWLNSYVLACITSSETYLEPI